ncbi:hypothetical protein H5410_048398 [Solanum commersonii]|uniref:Uncharacterized protein n=1 Tax=Solanum commersonii TaxID=4109 RepID=A0A9J5XKZ5_SOLCO|nr:hypothetical protein H5410_048398 [Solanum commersonii]
MVDEFSKECPVSTFLCVLAPDQWSFSDVTTMWSPIGGVRSMFAMYNLRVAKFDDVCYIQPPGGGV